MYIWINICIYKLRKIPHKIKIKKWKPNIRVQQIKVYIRVTKLEKSEIDRIIYIWPWCYSNELVVGYVRGLRMHEFRRMRRRRIKNYISIVIRINIIEDRIIEINVAISSFQYIECWPN